MQNQKPTPNSQPKVNTNKITPYNHFRQDEAGFEASLKEAIQAMDKNLYPIALEHIKNAWKSHRPKAERNIAFIGCVDLLIHEIRIKRNRDLGKTMESIINRREVMDKKKKMDYGNMTVGDFNPVENKPQRQFVNPQPPVYHQRHVGYGLSFSFGY